MEYSGFVHVRSRFSMKLEGKSIGMPEWSLPKTTQSRSPIPSSYKSSTMQVVEPVA